MELYGNQQLGVPGSTLGNKDRVSTKIAGQAIAPGDALFSAIGDPETVYKAGLTATAVTISALVESNRVALTVNSVAVDPVTVVGTGTVETARAIVDAINGNETLYGQNVTAFFNDAAPLKIYVQAPSTAPIVTGTITGGATQGTVTSAAFTSNIFVGVALYTAILAHRKERGFYQKTDAVNALERGVILVPITSTTVPAFGKPAYIVLTGADAGKFSDVSTSNYDAGCVFYGSQADLNTAYVEVRGIK
ncbi:hypothetical protein FACS1894172_14930 [Spirochaetia bacterium]|nr:hypothetical protein FACS1894172_14930 [Spirochaetia bacterium]